MCKATQIPIPFHIRFLSQPITSIKHLLLKKIMTVLTIVMDHNGFILSQVGGMIIVKLKK